MLKEELREIIKTRKRQFTEEHLRGLSLSALKRLMGSNRIKEAETILMYYSLADEVYTHDIIDTLCRGGKTILLPVVVSGNDMELRLYTGPEDLRRGKFGIMEPIGKVFTEYWKIDAAVIPGMSFDGRGNRLGRGKGYYDRFLAKTPYIYKIGICFGFQKTAEVPAEETDIRMDEVIFSKP